MRIQFLPLLFLIGYLAGCTTLLGPSVPGNTSADSTLRADVARMINVLERSQAPKCKHKIVDTRVVGIEGSTVKEEWVIESCGQLVVYPVSLTPDPKGGSYFGVSSPDRALEKVK